MLYVQFDCGKTEDHKVDKETWDKYNSMIVWLLYDPNEIYYIRRILYVDTDNAKHVGEEYYM